VSDLSELFDRNPLGLTTTEVGKIIERMRQSQAQYELGVKTAPRKAAKPKRDDLLKELDL
jgi:hypothetical protein